jgi:ABC-type transport system substrate-binding protein
VAALLACLLLNGCTEPVNAPRALADYSTNTIFSSFSGRSPKTLDPQVSYSSDETIYTYQVYEALYQYHYLKRPYEVIPLIAERVVEPLYLNARGEELPRDAPAREIAQSVYRIPIKKGVLFAPHPAFARAPDGSHLYHSLPDEQARGISSPLDLKERGTRELTAEDFVYGIKRLADPRLVSPLLGLMTPYIPGLADLSRRLQARVKTLSGALWMDLRDEPLEGVRALDRHTLEITIRGKYPQFDNWLAMAFFAPMPWEADRFYANPGLRENNISLATWPVGTGPFMLTASRTNREHVLERNPNYRLDTYPCEGEALDRERGLLDACGKPLPFADRIVMTLEKEAVPTTSKFLAGYYDSPYITRIDIGTGFLVAAEDSPEKADLYRERRLQFPKAFEANNQYLGFNWLDPVVGAGSTPEQARRNRLLRQALSIAIDWEEHIAIFERGQASPANGPVPPSLFGYREDGPTAFNPVVYRRDAEGRPVRRSIEEARELLRLAGYPGGVDAATGRPLVLHFDWQSASPGSKAFLEWMTRQFAKLGIQLEVRATDYNRFMDKMIRGVAQIYLWGWLADYPDAENFLMLLYGGNRKAGSVSGGENASNYSNPEYDRLFEQMKYLPEGEEKQRLIDRMVPIVQQDAPWSFGYFAASAAAVHHWVGNVKPTLVVNNKLKYMSIDAAERAQSIRAWNRPVIWPLALIALFAAGFVFAVVRHVRRAQGATAREPAGRGRA